MSGQNAAERKRRRLPPLPDKIVYVLCPTAGDHLSGTISVVHEWRQKPSSMQGTGQTFGQSWMTLCELVHAGQLAWQLAHR